MIGENQAFGSWLNKLTSRSLGAGLYEFKTKKSGIRLFAFMTRSKDWNPNSSSQPPA